MLTEEEQRKGKWRYRYGKRIVSLTLALHIDQMGLKERL
jgi:hypothetical protein